MVSLRESGVRRNGTHPVRWKMHSKPFIGADFSVDLSFETSQQQKSFLPRTTAPYQRNLCTDLKHMFYTIRVGPLDEGIRGHM